MIARVSSFTGQRSNVHHRDQNDSDLGFRNVGRLMAAVRLTVVFAGIVALGFGADDSTVITPGASRADAPAKVAGGNLSSMSLFLGVAMAGVGGWMVWRHRRGTPVGRDARALAIDETRSLGNRQFLVVASYEGKKFLIGVCPGRIDLLSALDGSSEKAKARE